MRFARMGILARVRATRTAQAASAEEIGRLLITDLSPTQSMEMGQWFTDAQQSGRDTRGLGIIHVHVTGLYGYSPRETLFFPDRIEIVTTTLGPNEPRCCPTVQTLWSIDLATGVAKEIE